MTNRQRARGRIVVKGHLANGDSVSREAFDGIMLKAIKKFGALHVLVNYGEMDLAVEGIWDPDSGGVIPIPEDERMIYPTPQQILDGPYRTDPAVHAAIDRFLQGEIDWKDALALAVMILEQRVVSLEEHMTLAMKPAPIQVNMTAEEALRFRTFIGIKPNDRTE